MLNFLFWYFFIASAARQTNEPIMICLMIELDIWYTAAYMVARRINCCLFLEVYVFFFKLCSKEKKTFILWLINSKYWPKVLFSIFNRKFYQYRIVGWVINKYVWIYYGWFTFGKSYSDEWQLYPYSSSKCRNTHKYTTLGARHTYMYGSVPEWNQSPSTTTDNFKYKRWMKICSFSWNAP